MVSVRAIAIFLMVNVVLVSIAQAESVRIRAASSEENGQKIGRMVFGWDIPVSYKAAIKGNTLSVSFSSVIDADISTIRRGLSAFVTNVQRGDDDRRVDLQLSGEFKLAHYPTGTSIVIELIDKAPQQQSASVQQAEPKVETRVETQTDKKIEDPGNLSEIKVRTGRHSDKLRIVFDWPSKVAYRFERNNDVIRIVFDSPVRIKSASLSRAAPTLIGAARSDVTSSQTIISLAVARGAKAKNFYAGSKIVLDLFFPGDGSVARKNLPEPKLDQETVQLQLQSQPQTKTTEATKTEVKTVSSEIPSVETSNVAKSTNTTAESDNSPTSLTTDTAVDVSATNVKGDAAGNEVPYNPNERYTGESSSGADVIDDGFAFRFDWDEPTGAAIFRRGGALWVVFDNPGDVNIKGMRDIAGKSVVDLVQLDHPEAVILRAITAPGINPLPRKDGLTWILEFRKQSLTTQTPIESLAQPESPLGARVFLPVAEPRAAVAITDPEIGDNFIVVPVVPLGYGVNHFYIYPQLRIRPSSQGIIIEPVIDTLQVRPIRDGVSIASTEIMHISPVSEEDIARARSDSSRPLSRIVDFGPVQGLMRQFYSVDRQDFEHAIISTENQDERIVNRLDYVRFLIAHGYGPEAFAALEVAAAIDQPITELASYYVYRGIANWMLRRYEKASEDLKSELLDKNDEGDFWRAIAVFSDGNRDDETIRAIRSTSKIPSTYPPELQSALTLKTIEASLAVEDIAHAREQIELLSAQQMIPKYQSELMLLSSRMNEMDGNVESAISNLEAVIAAEYEPTMVRGELLRIKLMLKLGRITPGSALVDLEGLRYAWRGGDFEFNLLRELGGVYILAGGYRQGLETLRQAASYFRNKEEAFEVTQQMSDVFSELFLEGKADEMLPISAIALYEEFKVLTPAGSLGDDMIRKLADRLVGVDLLDEAAVLLDSQIRHRLKGAEKARVGARLAVVKVLSKEYDMALDALDISQESDLPEQLEIQRRHLRARGLAGLGDDVSALLLLEDDESRAAEQLRVDIYRMTDDWSKASKSLGKIVNMTGAKPSQPLTEEQASYILSHAIALTLGNNDRGLSRLRKNYNEAMRETNLYDAFRLIATPEQFGLINYSAISEKVKVVERFQSFMANYKDRLKSGEPLSSIN
ncbi:MAG: hypothetical protein HON65_02245 [Rhodospirillales bacterium]|nr:hypothetical protein [Rhodospirillales bacterium]